MAHPPPTDRVELLYTGEDEAVVAQLGAAFGDAAVVLCAHPDAAASALSARAPDALLCARASTVQALAGAAAGVPMVLVAAPATPASEIEAAYAAGASDHWLLPLGPRQAAARLAALRDARRPARGGEGDWLQLIMRHMSGPAFVKDAAGRYLYGNTAFERLVGCGPGGWRGRSDAELFGDAAAAAACAASDAAARRSGGVLDALETVPGAGGARSFRVSKFPVQDGDQELLAGLTVDVTEQIRARDALRDSEERFRQLADNTDQVFYVLDAESGTCLYANHAFERVFQRPVAAVLADAAVFDAAVHPDDRAAVAAARARQLQGDLGAVTYRVVHAGGAVRWIKDRSSAVRDDGGRTIRIAGIAEDVTDAVQANESLAAKERWFRALIERSWDAIAVVDESGCLSYAAPAAERILGYERQALQGRCVADFLHPDDAAEVHAAFRELARSEGASRGTAFRCRHADGSWLWLEATGTNFLGEPSVRGIVVNIHDVTRRKRAEEDARRTAARLQAVTDALPALVSYVDADQRYRFVNAAYTSWFGVPAAQIVGARVQDVLGAHDFAAVEAHMLRALRGETVTNEVMLRSSPGGARDVSCTFVPDVDAAGRARGFVSLVHDVTELKRTERELERAKRAAEEASRAKSAFLANMSHEIRTPLGVILGFTELLCDPGLPAAERAAHTEAIRRSGRDLARLIDDILDLSKVEAGRLDIERLPVPLGELVDDVTGLLRHKADAKGVALAVERDPDLPPLIVSDPMRLRQILINLVGNAVKFTERGEVALHVHYTAETPAGRPQVAFVVRDSGCGMSRQQQARLFTPFAQADESTTRRFGGTGLGLALARRLAQALGGDVVLAASALGKGSTFVVTVDGHAPTPAQLARVAQARPARVAPLGALAGVQVLLVEDAPDNQLLLRRLLQSYGALVDVEGNGLDGAERALSGSYDVVLMDLQMPKLDGYQAASLLRSRGYDRPIIALTAHAMKEERERALAHGCDDHVTKPISRDVLIDTVARYAQAPGRCVQTPGRAPGTAAAQGSEHCH